MKHEPPEPRFESPEWFTWDKQRQIRKECQDDIDDIKAGRCCQDGKWCENTMCGWGKEAQCQR